MVAVQSEQDISLISRANFEKVKRLMHAYHHCQGLVRPYSEIPNYF